MDFPVYIDTSLGHNFVMLVSDSDTVHDVKGKILLEYANCFPEMGKINAHAIKIDHRGTLYRLSESVLVGKVFEATVGARLLHVDASSTGPKHNEVRLSKDFLINSKEYRDRNPTMLRIENNASHLLQCVPDIPCHSNRDGNSSGVIFDQNVHMVSDSPKKKSKRTKSIIGASGVGTSQSECGKGIDVSKVQKDVDYSHDLYKNVRQNASIKQGNNSSKRKDCGQQSDLQIDGQSDPRKKRHRKEDVHTKFDIDKPQVACKEILSRKSEENIFDRTNDPIVKQNNIDLTSLNTPKERKKKKKSSDVSHKQKYNSETTSSHLTLQVTNNDRSKHRKKKKKGKHSDNVEVKNILVAADNVEKSLADENGDPVIPMKNKSDTLTISSLETKNALAVSEKVNKEICRQLETPTSEFPLEKEQVIPFAEESAMNENSKELVLTSPLDAKAQSNDLETPGFRTIASLPQKISSLPESLGAIGFQEDVDLVIPSEDDVSTAPLANNDRSKRRKKKKKGKHSDNVEVKNILVAADNVEKSLADENGDSDIPMKNKSDTITVSSLETKNALAVSEKVNKEICRQLEIPTSEFPLEKEQVIPFAEESAMNENSIELVLTSPLDAKAQSNDFETPGFRTIASLPQKISSLPESLGAIGFQEDVDLVIPSEDDVSTAPLANNDRSKRRKKKKKGKHSDNVEVKNVLVAVDNVEKSLADENEDSDIPMKNKSDTKTVSSLETKNALAVSEKVNKEICRQLETPTSEFPLEKEQVIPVAEESAMNENSIELVLTSPLDAKAQSNDLETPGFRTIASLPQKISSLPESLGAIGFQEDVDLVIPSEDDVSTASLANKDKSKHCKKKKKGKDSDNVEAKNILVAADNVEKLLADENRDSAIPMKSTKNTLSVSSLETKTALAAAENVIEKICRQIETPTSEFPFEKEKVILVGGESVMDENSTELVLTSPSDAKMRPVVGEEVNFAEFFLPDVAVAKKRPTVSPEDSGNRKSEIKNRHIFKSKHRELQEEFTTKEELIGGEDENMQRIAKSKRDVENSNMSMQVTVPHRNVHIPCESTHTSKETNLTGIQTRKRSTKSSDKKVHGGVLLSDLEPRELIDNKSHKVKGKASPVNKKTERTKSNSSRKSNSNLAVHSDDVGKETKASLSVFDSKTKGRNDCYRIAFRKVSGGLLEILENSKTEKPLPFDSLSIFDHISDNVAKDKDTDNSKRQFDFSSSSSDSDSEISDVNETQTVHLHASQPFKESHGIHKSECISGDKSDNREILRHVTTGSQASGQEMKLGAILRNSRSYKKAKLVASQTPAEETEPESLL